MSKPIEPFVKIEGKGLFSRSFNDLSYNLGSSNNRISVLSKSPVEKMIKSRYPLRYSKAIESAIKHPTFESLDHFLNQYYNRNDQNKYQSRINESFVNLLQKSKIKDNNSYNILECYSGKDDDSSK